jgi:uncharacterized protein YndB with AHSA1/START domain
MVQMRIDEQDHVVSTATRVEAPASTVWSALTTPGELIQWYAPGCRWDIPELREGATVRFFNSETDIQSATIERCVPMTELVLRWRPDPNLPDTTLVNSYSLTPFDGGTEVVIAQTGYASVPAAQRASWIKADQQAFPAIAAALAAFVG